MQVVEVARSATAYPFITTISDASGPSAGNTVTQAVYDPATDQWLNMTTGAWQGTKDAVSKAEVETGIFRRTANISNAPGGTLALLGVADVTAGPAAGRVDYELLILRDTVEPPSSATIRDDILDRVLAGNHDGPGTTGELIQAGGTGGISTAALRDAIWNTLRADYNVPNTAGEWMNSTDLSRLDEAVGLLATELSRAGLPILNVNRTFYTGAKGDTLEFQFYQDEEPLADSILASATSIAVTLSPTNGDPDTVVTGTALLGGKVGYTLVDADGVFETAAQYDGQAKATLPGGEIKYSEMRLFMVRDPL